MGHAKPALSQESRVMSDRWHHLGVSSRESCGLAAILIAETGWLKKNSSARTTVVYKMSFMAESEKENTLQNLSLISDRLGTP
ncbi:hypothetical protein RRG08_039733 [Elysia crispata]|uniref:Uncharacterized protein n=1 Tax=Elysia crispata TaxID=231223 RepID=A0AAE1CV01_9GAST|nr:hypothetical protein RRG08_039733 [Elysia crispata]